jgi:hypothetical protein
MEGNDEAFLGVRVPEDPPTNQVGRPELNRDSPLWNFKHSTARAIGA